MNLIAIREDTSTTYKDEIEINYKQTYLSYGRLLYIDFRKDLISQEERELEKTIFEYLDECYANWKKNNDIKKSRHSYIAPPVYLLNIIYYTNNKDRFSRLLDDINDFMTLAITVFNIFALNYYDELFLIDEDNFEKLCQLCEPIKQTYEKILIKKFETTKGNLETYIIH